VCRVSRVRCRARKVLSVYVWRGNLACILYSVLSIKCFWSVGQVVHRVVRKRPQVCLVVPSGYHGISGVPSRLASMTFNADHTIQSPSDCSGAPGERGILYVAPINAVSYFRFPGLPRPPAASLATVSPASEAALPSLPGCSAYATPLRALRRVPVCKRPDATLIHESYIKVFSNVFLP
jgi:hypothetical protein